MACCAGCQILLDVHSPVLERQDFPAVWIVIRPQSACMNLSHNLHAALGLHLRRSCGRIAARMKIQKNVRVNPG